MAALNFVALEEGFEEDPELAALARGLRVSKAVALWSIVKLRRFILRRGNHLNGHLPKQVTPTILAAALDFQGKPAALVGALKQNGYLGCRRGRGFFYPAWNSTITGHYANRRETDRLWHEQQRSNRRSDDVARQSSDASYDRRTTSEDKSIERKEERNGAAPPVRPPKGGQAEGAARWDWMMEHAQTPQNREVCTRYLEALSSGDWELVQWAYTSRKKGGANISQKNARTLAWPTDVFLRKTAYLRFAGLKRQFETRGSAKSTDTAMAAGAKGKDLGEMTEKELKAEAFKFLHAFISDPDWSSEQKQKKKDEWVKKYGDKPWEKKG